MVTLREFLRQLTEAASMMAEPGQAGELDVRAIAGVLADGAEACGEPLTEAQQLIVRML